MPEVLSPEKTPTPKTADDINESFKEIVEEKKVPKEEKKEVKELPDKEDSEEEEEENEIELIDPDEDEKLDLEETPEDDKLEIDTPPRKKEILAKYPNLFKDFKFLEKAQYRDRQYSDLFGSFDDAKELAEKASVFNDFENQLLSGNTEEILKNVKENDPKAFDKIVDGYLRTLARVDKDAYIEVSGNVAKQLISEMFTEGKKTGNEDLQQAALLLNQFLGWGTEYTAPKPRVSEKSSEASEAEQEKQAFIKERFESAINDLQSRSDNTLKSTINEHIDPKGLMTNYIKRNAINDTMGSIQELMIRDTVFQKNLDRLWKSAGENR